MVLLLLPPLSSRSCQKWPQTAVSCHLEERLSGVHTSARLAEIRGNIRRRRMRSRALSINCCRFCFLWHVWCRFSRNRHVDCTQKIGTELLIFKREDKRDRLLLVIGHHHLSCSFPWKIALGKASYFQRYISDLDTVNTSGSVTAPKHGHFCTNL